MHSDGVEGIVALPSAQDLGLENQLLALEVQVLRGRMRVLQEKQARLSAQPSEPSPLPPGTIAVREGDYNDLKEAKRKLRWLLRRLGSGPWGWLIRTRPGYRVLAEQWLDDKPVASVEEEVAGSG